MDAKSLDTSPVFAVQKGGGLEGVARLLCGRDTLKAYLLPSGALVVINDRGQKFTYTPEQVQAVLPSPLGEGKEEEVITPGPPAPARKRKKHAKS